MEAIREFLKLDYVAVILAVFIIMSGVIAIYTIIGRFSEIIKKPVSWVKKKNEDHDMLLRHDQEIKNLAKKHKTDTDKLSGEESEIKKDITRLTNMFLDKQIDDMRYEILDFASSLSSGRKHNRESFDHILRIYKKYEQILEDNNMENGLVEESIAFIRERYKSDLNNGEVK